LLGIAANYNICRVHETLRIAPAIALGCREAAMAGMVVDVFLKDRLVASYTVVLDRLDAISEQDFIELAKGYMQENGYPAEDIAAAKFSVRSVPE
jgi:hypothetical protein